MHYTVHKVFCLILIQMVYLGYIHRVKPHNFKVFNVLEYFNEHCLLFLAYFGMLLFPVVNAADSTMYEILQNFCLTIFFSLAFVNLIVIVKMMILAIILICKKRKFKKAMQQRQKKAEQLKNTAEMTSTQKASDKKFGKIQTRKPHKPAFRK